MAPGLRIGGLSFVERYPPVNTSSRVVEWKARNPERARENARRSYYLRKTNDPSFPVRHQLAGIKARAKQKGVPFTLTIKANSHDTPH